MAHAPHAHIPTDPARPTAGIRFAPLEAMLTVLNGIVASNRFARDVERLSAASDARLAEMGLARDRIVPGLAARTHLFDVI